MVEQQPIECLNEIPTLWNVVEQAQRGPAAVAARAQQHLIQRYAGAVRRYLLAVLRDAEAAEDLTQEFALHVVQGRFHRADPRRGRFRDYIKVALLHLVSNYRERQRRQLRSLAPESPAWDILAAPSEEREEDFNVRWREELLARTWDALAAEHGGLYAVLRFRAEHPGMASEEMAQQLSRRLGRPFTAVGVRQTLRRARERFADLLLDEVAQSLEAPTVEQLAEELSELNLLSYCQPALERRTRHEAEALVGLRDF
jgi:RNA polymerase sigma-70 factor (ECF subfamily)